MSSCVDSYDLDSFWRGDLTRFVLLPTVITSISVLFASLVSLTISNLHSRQVDTHKALVVEVHHLRQLLTLLESPAAVASFGETSLQRALLLARQHREVLFSPRYTTSAERKNNAHAYIESCLPALFQWTNEQELWREQSRRQQTPSCPATAQMLTSQIQQNVHRLMSERGKVRQYFFGKHAKGLTIFLPLH